MYLSEITVRNFSIHKDSKFQLHPITVLVGPNGGGKSAFFDALINFSMLSRGNIGQAFGHFPYSFAATRYRGASSIGRISFDALLAPTKNSAEQLHYEVAYSQEGSSESSNPKFQIHTERLVSVPSGDVLFDRNNPEGSRLPAAAAYLAGDTAIFAAVRRALPRAAASLPPSVVACARDISRFNKFRLDPQVLAAPSDLPDLTSSEAPRIAYQGGNLAAALYFLHETSHPGLVRVVDELKAVLPGFEDFEFNSVVTQRIGYSARFSDQRQSISAPRLSDGQRLLIGLMALIYSPGRPPILMIEEQPENGLTAPAQRAFYRAVHHLASQPTDSERSQILISSHSPFVLCEAWNGEDRDFILQVKVEQGRAMVRSFGDAVTASGVMLGRADDGRLNPGLKNAEELMSGYLA